MKKGNFSRYTQKKANQAFSYTRKRLQNEYHIFLQFFYI